MENLYIKKYVSYSKRPTGLLFHIELGTEPGVPEKKVPATLALTPIKGGAFRYRMVVGRDNNQLDGIFFDARKLAKSADASFKLKNTGAGIEVLSGPIKIEITKDPWSFRVLDRKGRVVYAQNTADRSFQGYFTFPSGICSDSGKVKKVRETAVLGVEEHVYGLGEKYMPIDKKGRKVESWTVDAQGLNTTDCTYKNIPFFMSSNGYGIFVNTGARIVYDIGCSSAVSLAWEIDDNIMDYFFFYGPDLKKIIAKYHSLTGKPPVPPKWSFGVWMSRCMYRNKEEVNEVIAKMRKNKLPLDVIHLDPLWLKGRKELMAKGIHLDSCYGFNWDDEAFGDAKTFIKSLHDRGVKLSLWENPYVYKDDTDTYKYCFERRLLVARKKGGKYRPAEALTYGTTAHMTRLIHKLGVVDFTNPDAVKWYKERHARLLKLGVDAFKTDYGEWAPVDAFYKGGIDGKYMHNIYPLLYNKAVFEVTKKINKRGIVFGRSAYAGIQKYPLQWSGDAQCTFGALPSVLRSGLSYGMSGVPFWSNDIGGFVGKPTPELYIRWLEFGLFVSHSRFHGLSPREPWEYGKKALKAARFYSRLRYRLLPYIYSYAHEASRTGLPMIRPIVLEYQKDPNAHDKDTEFLFGEELLVAPVLTEETRRNVYFPEGKWFDFWSGKEYSGPGTVDYKAPLEKLPLFVKADSIIPFGPDRQFIRNKPEKKLRLEIYLDRKAEFTYRDDFETIRFSAERKGDDIAVRADKPKEYIISLNGVTKPGRITFNGKPVSGAKASGRGTTFRILP